MQSNAPQLGHQRYVGRLYLALGNYLASNPIGEVLMAPADISWGPDVLVQPDVFVVPTRQSRASNWTEIRDLILVA